MGFSLTLLTIGCNSPATDSSSKTAESTTMSTTASVDASSLKTDVQAMETAWAEADNARDANAIANFYADDAISMSNNKPSLSGKAAILQDIQDGMAKRSMNRVVAYDVTDVYPGDNTATEVGKITVKDTTGKVTYTGKYMAVWEKRNGKYVCIRDISNDDAKEK